MLGRRRVKLLHFLRLSLRPGPKNKMADSKSTSCPPPFSSPLGFHATTTATEKEKKKKKKKENRFASLCGKEVREITAVTWSRFRAPRCLLLSPSWHCETTRHHHFTVSCKHLAYYTLWRAPNIKMGRWKFLTYASRLSCDPTVKDVKLEKERKRKRERCMYVPFVCVVWFFLVFAHSFYFFLNLSLCAYECVYLFFIKYYHFNVCLFLAFLTTLF